MKSICSVLLMSLLLMTCGPEGGGENTKVSVESPESAVITEPHRADPPARPSPPSDLMDEEEETGEVVTTPVKIEDVITKIRGDYARIQQQLEEGTLREEITTYECPDDPEEGELVRYYAGDDLVMLRLSKSISHSWETKSVYLVDNEPFFVFEEEGYWQFGGPENGDAPHSVDKITETRYYLEDGEIIRQLNKEYEIRSWEKGPDSSEVPNTSVDVSSGEEYPLMSAIPQWKMGDISC